MSEVIIAGGGPVGLGLAIDLALKGVTATVLERSESLHGIPKGQNLTQRTGEHFRAWGVSGAVRAASPIPPEFGNAGLVTYGNLLSRHHYDWFQRSRVGAYYFAENERLPQYNLERVLRDRASELPEITLTTGATVTDVEQDASGTHVQYETAQGERRSLSAEFCVGCDGARSITREEAGIRSDTDCEGPFMVLLVFRSMELHNLLERHPGKSIFNVMNPDMDGYWQFLGRVDLNGGWFFHSPVPKGTTKAKLRLSCLPAWRGRNGVRTGVRAHRFLGSQDQPGEILSERPHFHCGRRVPQPPAIWRLRGQCRTGGRTQPELEAGCSAEGLGGRRASRQLRPGTASRLQVGK